METTSPLKVVLIGASVRPLIASCLNAGHIPVAFDFFADWDGQKMIQESGCDNASLTEIDQYEDLLELDFASLGDAAILTGGAELRSNLVRTVGEQIPLLGPSAESLAMIGDPLNWLRVLLEAGCRVPNFTHKSPVDYLTSGWLVKQRGTCGGGGVQVLDKWFKEGDVKSSVGDSYFQERIEGQAWSVILVSRSCKTGDASTTFSLGYTKQWLASDFAEEIHSWSRQTSGHCHEVPRILADPATSESRETTASLAKPFAYRGSIGPLAVCKSVQLQVERIADLLGNRFAMQGVWGIDFMLDAEGQVWPVDFNPRITASAELFEATTKQSSSRFRSTIDLHLAACCATSRYNDDEFKKLAVFGTDSSNPNYCEAKRILYLGSESVKIDKVKWERLLSFYEPNFCNDIQIGVSIADVPRLGDLIEARRPLLTIRSRAKTEATALDLLAKLSDAVRLCISTVD